VREDFERLDASCPPALVFNYVSCLLREQTK
jgi:hypothetical protein